MAKKKAAPVDNSLRDFKHVVHAHTEERLIAFKLGKNFRKQNLKRTVYLDNTQLSFSDKPFGEGVSYLSVDIDREILGVDVFWCNNTNRTVLFIFTQNAVYLAMGIEGETVAYRFNTYCATVQHILAKIMANMPNHLYPGLQSVLFSLVQSVFLEIAEHEFTSFGALSGAPKVQEKVKVVIDPKYFPKVKVHRDHSVYNVDMMGFTEVRMGQ